MGATDTAALQILENYEPQRMLINNTFREGEPEPPDFIYRGNGDGPRMGELFSVLRPEDRRQAGLDRVPGNKKPA